MKRRDLLKLGGMALAQTGIARLLSQTETSPAAFPPEGKADYTLRIAPVTVELDRSHILSTIGYNSTAPGPVLRMREGKSVAVEVINDTDTPEFVEWHAHSARCGWDRRRRIALHTPTQSATFPAHAGSGRKTLVSLPCHGDGQ